jgi:phosphoribosyl 1,2-cyclic phosphodiesterase
MYGFCPLASGSKGNALFLGSQNTKILIDAGISTKSLIEKLSQIQVSLDEIDAILISHDHSDHISGLKTLAIKQGIPVLANAETAKGICSALGACPKFKIFETGETFEFEDLKIHPFSIQHDTVDPVAFTLEVDQIRLGVCADLGFATSLVKNRLQGCDYLYLEANHEPAMVHASSRPLIYKQRVLSRNGHLSNEECANLLADIVHPELKHVYLAHLSSECNTPIHALNRVQTKVGSCLSISIAPQEIPAQPLYFHDTRCASAC